MGTKRNGFLQELQVFEAFESVFGYDGEPILSEISVRCKSEIAVSRVSNFFIAKEFGNLQTVSHLF